ncbi:MAG: hypothetical protein Q8P02_04800, partial [Candidatus Micrarchaeota archaeon]|nr:hypothetical protein [Candidatus Micrarchaeota archaeon]
LFLGVFRRPISNGNHIGKKKSEVEKKSTQSFSPRATDADRACELPPPNVNYVPTHNTRG